MSNEYYYPWIISNLYRVEEFQLYTIPVLQIRSLQFHAPRLEEFDPDSILGWIISYQYSRLFQSVFNVRMYSDLVLLHAAKSPSLEIFVNLYQYEASHIVRKLALNDSMVSGNEQVVEYLLNTGVNWFNARMLRTVEKGHFRIIKMYFRAVDPNLTFVKKWFLEAARYDQLEIFRWLLENNIFNNKTLEEALTLAINKNSVQVGELLLKSRVRLRDNIQVGSREILELIQDLT